MPYFSRARYRLITIQNQKDNTETELSINLILLPSLPKTELKYVYKVQTNIFINYYLFATSVTFSSSYVSSEALLDTSLSDSSAVAIAIFTAFASEFRFLQIINVL